MIAVSIPYLFVLFALAVLLGFVGGVASSILAAWLVLRASVVSK
jgi:hypothetical protein